MKNKPISPSPLQLLFVLFIININIIIQNCQIHAQGNDDEITLYSNPQFFTTLSSSSSEQTGGEGGEEYNTTLQEDNNGGAIPMVGLLFNVRSKVDNPETTIYITGFEFYTTTSGSVYYELRTREGEYYDEPSGMDGGVAGIGAYDSFDLISLGIADGSGECAETIRAYKESGLFDEEDDDVCSLSIVPEEDFDESSNGIKNPWRLKGANATRSFYITLASMNLLVLPSKAATTTLTNDEPLFDTVVVASTDDLEIYEGVGAQTYPFHETEDFYHGVPLEFIGKIHYQVQGGVEEVPPQPEPTSIPSVELSASPTVTASPSRFGETKAPATLMPTYAPTLKPTTGSPTPKPTKRCRPNRPCIQPPPPEPPTMSPIVSSPVPALVEMMVVVEDVPNRSMEPREEEEYIKRMTDFLKGNQNLQQAGIKTSRVKIFFNTAIEEEKGRGKQQQGSGNETSLSDSKESTNSFIYYYNSDSQYYPEVFPAVLIMTEIEIVTKLPFDVSAFYIWDELRDGEEELLRVFHRNILFVSFFRDMTSMVFEVVSDLTKPPTKSPTSAPTDPPPDNGEMTEEEQRQLYIWVGIAVGGIWCCLTSCGFKEIFKHRSHAKEQIELRNTMTSQKREEREKRAKGKGRARMAGAMKSLPSNIGNSKRSRKKERDFDAMEGQPMLDGSHSSAPSTPSNTASNLTSAMGGTGTDRTITGSSRASGGRATPPPLRNGATFA